MPPPDPSNYARLVRPFRPSSSGPTFPLFCWIYKKLAISFELLNIECWTDRESVGEVPPSGILIVVAGRDPLCDFVTGRFADLHS